MPIKLNDIKSVANAKKDIFSPKFFCKDITGTGKTVGVININMYPINIPQDASTNITQVFPEKITTVFDKHKKETTYPLDPLGGFINYGVPNDIFQFDPTWCKISAPVFNNANTYAFVTPVAISLSEPLATDDGSNNTPSGKTATVHYALIFAEIDTSNGNNVIIEHYYRTDNPLTTFEQVDNDATDIAAFMKYLANYNLYDNLCNLSKIWQTNLIDVAINTYDKFPNTFNLASYVRYIAQYKVSLQQYKDLYDKLLTRVTPDVLKHLTKMNTSLLLQDTLKTLEQTQFAPLPSPGATNKQLDLSWCSKEQFDAVTSTAPLNQVQAGAGTGKSTVIKARLDYLDYLGVDMDKVMVLSFTNAAADNIKARCPGIQSMTIAKMIDAIYCKNHPTHQLSPSLAKRGEGSTFTNSLVLYKDKYPLITPLIDAVNRVEKNNDYATMLRLVEENYDDIITILDEVGQTTFHLEIILCYLEHATMKIPFDIEYLLIDEVQDNAVFEFIFFLNLTCKLKNHLYLVGDCSQTLYEFRASDPRALNAIEGSGVFATFPLNINYRSNQNILHFANSLLDDIDANQFANIQLQSFNLSTVIRQSFAESVFLDYTRLDKKRELEELLTSKLSCPTMHNWIEDKLLNHEQICILSYKRKDANMIQRILEKLYPNASFMNIIPAKNVSFAYFSRYVSNNHAQLDSLPTNSANALCDRVKAEILANLTNSYASQTSPSYAKTLASLQQMLLDWETKNKAVISDMLSQFNLGIINRAQLTEFVGKTLIDFEIERNALKQSLVSQRNATKKESTDNANFVFSTIHSAKGLEFDNVILLYENQNHMDEETKRMYYVALTRAKKNEYIIAYDTVTHALVQTRYDTLMARLPDAISYQAAVS